MRRPAAVAAALALALAACPAPRTAVRPSPSALPVEVRDGARPVKGVVHVVQPGETLWRIARAYGITPDDLMETNGIADARAVPAGMELFVPGATHLVAVPPPPSPLAPGAAPSPPAAATAPAAARAAAPLPPTAPAPVPAPTRAASADPSPVEPRAPASARGSGRLAWPLQGQLLARYGVRDGERHDGIDVGARAGTPVLAAADGVVLWVGAQPGYGRLVILRHATGLLTLYAHVEDIAVTDGARVRRGQPIAKVGRGEGTGAPQVHFEVREGTRPRNPLLYLP